MHVVGHGYQGCAGTRHRSFPLWGENSIRLQAPRKRGAAVGRFGGGLRHGRPRLARRCVSSPCPWIGQDNDDDRPPRQRFARTATSNPRCQGGRSILLPMPGRPTVQGNGGNLKLRGLSVCRRYGTGDCWPKPDIRAYDRCRLQPRSGCSSDSCRQIVNIELLASKVPTQRIVVLCERF